MASTDRNAMVLKLSGQADVVADRVTVWDALHDAACLKMCIPGCRTIERVSPTRYELSVGVGIGPIAVAVTGAVEIHESDEPCLLCLRATGSGGLAGVVGGQLRMTLFDTPLGCRIAYVAEVEPKGALGALGADLLADRARRLVDRFIVTFVETVGAPPIVRRSPGATVRPIDPSP